MICCVASLTLPDMMSICIRFCSSTATTNTANKRRWFRDRVVTFIHLEHTFQAIAKTWKHTQMLLFHEKLNNSFFKRKQLIASNVFDYLPSILGNHYPCVLQSPTTGWSVPCHQPTVAATRPFAVTHLHTAQQSTKVGKLQSTLDMFQDCVLILSTNSSHVQIVYK